MLSFVSMAEVNLRWVGEFNFVGVDSSRHSVVISGMPPDRSIGLKPAEMLLLALGACTGYDVVNILKKKRQELTGLEISVSGEQDPTPPWAFRRIVVTYRVRGRGLDSKAVQDAVRLSEEKYCSVSATVRGVVRIEHNIELADEEQAPAV